MPTEVIGNYQPPPRAFGDEIAQTDDGAFNNKVVLTDDGASSLKSNSYLRFPKSKQTESWFTFGYPMGNWIAALLLFRERAEPYCLENDTQCLQR